jgi:hypothetical protein
MNYTDTQLKQSLAKMIPGQLYFNTGSQCLCWISKQSVCGTYVLDTELLHLCWLVGETLSDDQFSRYAWELLDGVEGKKLECRAYLHSTWQQRTIALAEVKGIEIV